MNENGVGTWRRGMTEEQILEVFRLPQDVAREYFMERRYHGVSHAEGLRRAWNSPWIDKENK